MAGIDTPVGYTRLQRMGAGAEADVYRAWDERASRWAMLKLFHRFVRGRAEESAFAAHVAASIGLGGDPAIVPVRSGGITATGRPWLALDLVDGRTLADVLRDDPPSPAEGIQLAVVLADALAWAHSMRPQMVHGRLRPEFVLIDASGRPMLTDFVAPLGGAAPTPRGDVTALGALLFRVLTGHDWPGDTDRADRIISVWPGLSRLFDEVLTPVPAIDSMAVFAARLRQVRRASGAMIPLPAAPGREITPASPVLPQTPSAYAWKRRFPAIALVAAVPVAVAAVLLPTEKPTEKVAVVATVCPPHGVTPATLWWPADEGAGATACDFSGSGNPASLSPGAAWAGGALRFTAGTSGSYASGRAPAVRTDQSFTVMAWVNLSDTDTPHGVLSQPGTVSSGFILKYEKLTDSWRLTMPQTDSRSPVVDGPSSTSRPRVGAWTHLAATYDAGAGAITLYVDGAAENTVKHPVSWHADGPVQVARSWYNGAWSDRFAGSIDDIRAYQSALGPDGITEIVESGRATHSSGGH